MKWYQDITRDIRTFSNFDDYDSARKWATVEVSECNRQMLLAQFTRLKNSCKAILEIGIQRNGDSSFTQIFLGNKLKQTIYLGIDINDKSFLNNTNENIYTLQTNSSDYNKVVEYARSIGVNQFDFIFIDGDHSINQVLRDWEYTNLLSEKGIVGFHDTAYHYGPENFIKNLDLAKWEVIRNGCADENDYGVGFCWKKVNY